MVVEGREGRIQWKQILYKSGTLQQVIPTKLRGKDSIYLLSYTSAIFSVVDYAYLSLLDNAPNYLGSWVRYPKEIDLVLGIFVIQKCNKTWKFLTTLFFGMRHNNRYTTYYFYDNINFRPQFHACFFDMKPCEHNPGGNFYDSRPLK